jgi:hypothetical protein
MDERKDRKKDMVMKIDNGNLCTLFLLTSHMCKFDDDIHAWEEVVIPLSLMNLPFPLTSLGNLSHAYKMNESQKCEFA